MAPGAKAVTAEALARDADIVVEAVFERMDVKQEVFRKLDAVARPGAILASNTSTLDVDRIAATVADSLASREPPAGEPA